MSSPKNSHTSALKVYVDKINDYSQAPPPLLEKVQTPPPPFKKSEVPKMAIEVPKKCMSHIDKKIDRSQAPPPHPLKKVQATL